MGEAVSNRARQHSPGAHGGRARAEERVDCGGGDLCADGAATLDDRRSPGVTIPLAIVGYGKMGRMVEQLASEFGFAVCARLNGEEMARVAAATLNEAAVAIEFTNAAAAPENLRRLAGLGVNTVCGTT